MPKVQLTLDPPRNEDYRPGEELTGTAYFGLESTRKINSFYLILKGHAEYNFSEDGCFQMAPKQICYQKQEFVTATDRHRSGHFSFAIHLKIPEDLPSSVFESNNCAAYNRISIKYYLSLILDVPWRRKFKAKKEIEIVRCDDFNLIPFVRNKVPLVTSETFKVKTMFSTCGNMHVKVILPYGAFARGETIPILINTENETDKKFDKIKIVLNQQVLSVDEDGSVMQATMFENDATKVQFNIGEVEGVCAVLSEIKVPEDLYLTNAPFCEVVKIVHKIKIFIYPESSFVEYVLMEVPVIIGSIPIELNDEEKMKIKSFFAHKQSWETPERIRHQTNMTQVSSEYRKESKRFGAASLIPTLMNNF